MNFNEIPYSFLCGKMGCFMLKYFKIFVLCIVNYYNEIELIVYICQTQWNEIKYGTMCDEINTSYACRKQINLIVLRDNVDIELPHSQKINLHFTENLLH